MDSKRRLGKRIRALREAANISQEKLAELADKSVDSISKIERGINCPTIETANDIANALKIELVQMLEGVFEDKLYTAGTAYKLSLESALFAAIKSLDENQLENLLGIAKSLFKLQLNKK